MDPLDIIPIPWAPEHYARRALVDALERAGRPPINSALRLYDEQKRAWDAYQEGTGSPADDPDRPDQFPLVHVRGVGADIDPTPERVAALYREGLERPYAYEPWHWQLPNARSYPLVYSIPSYQEEDMPKIIKRDNAPQTFLIAPGFLRCHEDEHEQRVDRELYGNAVKSFSDDDFRRSLKNHGFGAGIVGNWADPSWVGRLPKPGEAFIEPPGTK